MAPLRFATRTERMAGSATAAVSLRVTELRAQGVDVVSLAIGELDSEPPPRVVVAAKQALEKGGVRYTEVSGLRQLREAICRDSLRRRGVLHTPEEVVVGAGAKHVLFNLAQALYDHGDEVVIPVPAWGSYAEQAKLCGAQPVLVPGLEQDGFLVRPEALAEALSPRTKAIVLCTPSNPTGAAYRPAQLEAIASVLRTTDAYVIVDEIYAELTYDDLTVHSLLSIAPDLRERLVIVDGVSKRFAMTGYRVGWMLGSSAIARVCNAIQSQATTSISAISQRATIAALEGGDEEVLATRASLQRRRDRMVAGLNAIPGIRARVPEGAFYVFASIEALLGRGGLSDDVAVARYLLEQAKVAVVPGSDFHAPGYVRLAYATSEEQIERALSQIAAAIAALPAART